MDERPAHGPKPIVDNDRSRRIGRVRVLDEPPSVYEAELTDKTYINQRAGLERRQALAEELYSEAPGHEVIILD